VSNHQHAHATGGDHEKRDDPANKHCPPWTGDFASCRVRPFVTWMAECLKITGPLLASECSPVMLVIDLKPARFTFGFAAALAPITSTPQCPSTYNLPFWRPQVFQILAAVSRTPKQTQCLIRP